MRDNFKHTHEVARETAKRMIGGEVFPGIKTGFPEIDDLTGGFRNGDLIVLGGRPSMGKTAFALGVFEYVATKAQVPSVFFSLEMSISGLMERLLLNIAGIPKLKLDKYCVADIKCLEEAAETVIFSPMIIDDTAAISLESLCEKCREYRKTAGIGLIIIDYLQLIDGRGKGESFQEQTAGIMKTLKSLARELDCPILLLSSLSRVPEQRADHRPLLADFQGSESIADEADEVIFLYRDDYYDKSCRNGIAEVHIAKHNKGETGCIELAFLSYCGKFVPIKKR